MFVDVQGNFFNVKDIYETYVNKRDICFNLQDSYVNMQLIYVDMQDNYINMQDNYVNMQLIYDNMQDNYVGWFVAFWEHQVLKLIENCNFVGLLHHDPFWR